MNSNTDRKTDQLLKNAICKITPDSPGEGFVFAVMQKVQQTDLQTSKNAEPLITWKGWLTLASFFLTLFGIAIYSEPAGWSLDVITRYYNEYVAGYLSIFLSRISVMGILVLTLFFLIQVRLISTRLQKLQQGN
ncbi:MAG: hypothetical protein ACM3PT_13750 [Deltaproteobacteria bacterium]